MADANIPYHCHTERPQVGHVLGDAIVVLITRQEVHTHHQVADVHTHNAYSLPVHSPYGTSPQSRPVGRRPVFIANRKSDTLPAYLGVGASLQNCKTRFELQCLKI